MAVYYSQLVFVTLCVSVFIHGATSLRCFVCSSQAEDCLDPFNITKHTADTCDRPDAVCLKQILPGAKSYKESTHRGCVQEDYCEFFKKTSKHCTTCKKDFCNSSVTTLPSYSCLMLLVCFHIYNYLNR